MPGEVAFVIGAAKRILLLQLLVVALLRQLT